MTHARTKWLGMAAVAVVLAGAATAQAQNYGYYPRHYGYGTPAYQAYVANLRTYAWAANRGFVSPYYGYPYGYGGYGYGYGGYYPTYTENPYGAYLRGGAEVINAQGRYLTSVQEANLLREQVKAAQIANRRSAFDHYLYERENAPTPQQLRAEERARRTDRARSNPPATEIYSATSLNDLLADLRQTPLAGVPDAPVNADAVRQVNVTSARNGANIGLFRQGGRLAWPALFDGPAFKTARDRLTVLAEGTTEQVRRGAKADGATLKQMDDDLEALHQKLSEAVADVPADRHIEARRFLNQVGDAVKALQQPDAAGYFDGRYEFRGKSAAELVKFMTERGLWFAPATPGAEPAYAAVHQALAAYSTAAHTNALQTGAARR